MGGRLWELVGSGRRGWARAEDGLRGTVGWGCGGYRAGAGGGGGPGEVEVWHYGENV